MKNFLISLLCVLFIGISGRMIVGVDLLTPIDIRGGMDAVILLVVLWNALDIWDLKKR